MTKRRLASYGLNLVGVALLYAAITLAFTFNVFGKSTTYIQGICTTAYNSWGICDSSCATCHFMKKDQEYWYGYLQKWLKSSREYEIRFGVVCLLDFFINEAYIDAVLEEMKKIHHDGYYVKMAVAWAVSICYIHFPEKTQKLLKENSLDDWTHNKTIQKIRESLRISKEEKEMLKTWKR